MPFVVWVLSRDPDDLSTSTEGEGVRMCRTRFLQNQEPTRQEASNETYEMTL